jgi:ribonuclease HI
MIEAFFDGACEPMNPGGTMSFGIAVFEDGKPVYAHGQICYSRQGEGTSNNVAEYKGFIALLTFLEEHGWAQEKITVCGDSQLVVCQMLKMWQINHGIYVPYAEYALTLLPKFPNLKIKWVKREKNAIADDLSKKALIKAGIKITERK